MKRLITLLFVFSFACKIIAQKSESKDQFGITQFYLTKESTIEWNSAHWNNGISRNIKYSKDKYDPTNYTEDHSGSTKGFEIDGNGGMVVGVRSGSLAHATNSGNDCDATTYYAIFRHDGNWDFEKELKHLASSYRNLGSLNDTETLWNGNKMPEING